MQANVKRDVNTKSIMNCTISTEIVEKVNDRAKRDNKTRSALVEEVLRRAFTDDLDEKCEEDRHGN